LKIYDQPITVWTLIEDSLRKEHGRTLTYVQLGEVYHTVQQLMKVIEELRSGEEE
jgi:hypothetical protein